MGTSIEAIPQLKEIIKDDNLAMNPFGGIETEQKQHKFYREHFHLVVCKLNSKVFPSPTMQSTV